MSNPSSSPPVSWISGTSGFEEAGQRLPKREEAEDPARMDEADALAERLRIALERVEKPAEGLGGVHGIEHHALFPRHPDQERELAVVDGGPSRALVAVEEMNGLGHFEGESVAAATDSPSKCPRPFISSTATRARDGPPSTTASSRS